jgi:hypothetical protein
MPPTSGGGWRVARASSSLTESQRVAVVSAVGAGAVLFLMLLCQLLPQLLSSRNRYRYSYRDFTELTSGLYLVLLGLLVLAMIFLGSRDKSRMTLGLSLFGGAAFLIAVEFLIDAPAARLLSVLALVLASSGWIVSRRASKAVFALLPITLVLSFFAAVLASIQMDTNDGWATPLYLVLPVIVTAWLARLVDSPPPAPAAGQYGVYQQPVGFAPDGQPVFTYSRFPAAPAYMSARTNSMSVVSLCLAVLGLGIPAIVCAHIGRSQIRWSGEGGWQSTTAAIVLGYFWILVAIVAIVTIVNVNN